MIKYALCKVLGTGLCVCLKKHSKIMPFYSPNLKWKTVLSVGFGVLIFLIAVWMMTGWVRAYWVLKTVHIFPRSVQAIGWDAQDKALRQDLSPKAKLESFGPDNSAFIHLAGTTTPVIETQTPINDNASTTPVLPPMVLNPELPPTIDQFPNLVPVLTAGTSSDSLSTSTDSTTSIASSTSPQASSTLDIATTSPVTSTTTDGFIFIPTSTSTPHENVPTTTPEILPLPLPVMLGTSSAATSSNQTATSTNATSTGTTTHADAGGARVFVEGVLQKTLGMFVDTAFATSSVATTTPNDTDASDAATTTPSVHDDVPDVSVCSTLGTPCHTIAFSGFAVSGELRDTILKDAVLNFSFGGKVPESSVAEDKLLVRYFAKGQWRQAGEIYLNKELSNDANGGYFTAKLDTVDSWNDLNDMHVVIEFVRQSGEPVELYLDSAWVDAQYKFRAQQVLAGNTLDETKDLPDNASLTLNNGGADPSVLALPDGQSITLGYADDVSEYLLVRTDKQTYVTQATSSDRAVAEVYTSVTNTSKKQRFVYLVCRISGKWKPQRCFAVHAQYCNDDAAGY